MSVYSGGRRTRTHPSSQLISATYSSEILTGSQNVDRGIVNGVSMTHTYNYLYTCIIEGQTDQEYMTKMELWKLFLDSLGANPSYFWHITVVKFNSWSTGLQNSGVTLFWLVSAPKGQLSNFYRNTDKDYRTLEGDHHFWGDQMWLFIAKWLFLGSNEGIFLGYFWHFCSGHPVIIILKVLKFLLRWSKDQIINKYESRDFEIDPQLYDSTQTHPSYFWQL